MFTCSKRFVSWGANVLLSAVHKRKQIKGTPRFGLTCRCLSSVNVDSHRHHPAYMLFTALFAHVWHDGCLGSWIHWRIIRILQRNGIWASLWCFCWDFYHKVIKNILFWHLVKGTCHVLVVVCAGPAETSGLEDLEKLYDRSVTTRFSVEEQKHWMCSYEEYFCRHFKLVDVISHLCVALLSFLVSGASICVGVSEKCCYIFTTSDK